MSRSKDNWESWIGSLYAEKFGTIQEAEAYVSVLANEFFAITEDAPFIKTRPKSLPSLTEKIHRKLAAGDDNIKNFVSKQILVKELFSNESGISDLIGLRLIFLRFPNTEQIRVDFITNFLVGKHGFKASVLDDVKIGENGYKAIHFKLQFPEKYDGINF